MSFESVARISFGNSNFSMVIWTMISGVLSSYDEALPNGDAEALQSIIPMQSLNGMRSP